MNKTTKTSNETSYRAVRGILGTDEYRHEFAHFFEGTIKTLGKNEIIDVHRLLVGGLLIESQKQINNTKRPSCPITGPKKINQAKADYKIAMIAYIASFGIHLTENAPCNYPPAVLEALANYCDKNLNSN